MKLTTALLVTTLSAALGCSAVFACTSDGKEGIFPENNLYIPPSAFSAFSATEAEFNAANAKATKVYGPVFAAQGREYKIIADWKDGTVNAYANRSGKVSEVHMFGGLARAPKMTSDGFVLVICHETGHHLGGGPKTRGILGSSWASNEGQSDYFATLKCAREMWKDEDNAAVVAKMEVPALVTERCQKGFDKAEDISLCQRSALAGKVLGDVLADLGKTAETKFETPDTSVVTRTNAAHPAAQCRTDTYFAGAVCSASKDIVLTTDPTVGTCAQETGAVMGVRPLCWYKPMTKGEKPSSSWPSMN